MCSPHSIMCSPDLATSQDFFFFKGYGAHRDLPSFPPRPSSDLVLQRVRLPGRPLLDPVRRGPGDGAARRHGDAPGPAGGGGGGAGPPKPREFVDRAMDDDPRRSEEHTSELQSPCNLVCRLLLEK